MVMNTTFAMDPAEGFSLGEKLLDKNDNGYFVAYTSSERLKPPTFSSRRRLLGAVIANCNRYLHSCKQRLSAGIVIPLPRRPAYP